MEYLLPIALIVLSYLSGAYFAYQGLRNVIDRPLAYSNELVVLILTILFGWAPTLLALYLAYKNSGLFFAIILVVVRFIFMPTALNDRIKIYMDNGGI